MPLIKSASKKAVSANIRAEMSAGKPQKQAIAIALDVARRSRRKADGGAVEEDKLIPPPRNPARAPIAVEDAAMGAIVDPFASAYRAAKGRLTDTEAQDFAFGAALGLIPVGRGLKSGVSKGLKELFHVAGDDYQVGQPLRSLYSRYGNDAYEMFAKRWPDAHGLGQDHAHKTFFYATAKEAQDHADLFGGRILKIDPAKVEGLKFDKLEKPGYWVTTSDVSPEAISPFGKINSSLAVQPATGIRAYHGSPHDFDRFDMSKIGTGEGAQAYGHGLYFAENEGVARSYRDRLQPVLPFQGIKSIADSDVRATASHLMEAYGTDAAVARLRGMADKHPDKRPQLIEAATIIEANASAPGRMYEVNINASPDRFIDWDAPLSKQPHLEQTMRRVGADPTGPGFEGPLTGAEGYRALQNKYFLDQIAGRGTNVHPNEVNVIASQAVGKMAQEGIPGIKYLDQGSRTAGEGSRNYVVFDDKLIDILRKYGVTSVAALPPAVQASLGIMEDGQVKKSSGGAAMQRARQYAAGGATRVPGPSFFQRDANRALARQSGLIKSVVPGRTDKHPMRVASGSYILPADVVSHLGQNNTLSGAKFLRRKFGGGGVIQFADGGDVPMPVDIVAAGGEFVLSPDQVRAVGGGDLKKGHAKLDKMVLDTRRDHIKTLKNLAPPKRS